MEKGKLIVAFVLEGLGIWVIADSYRMGPKSFNNPGPGLYPFILGVLLCLLAIPLCAGSLKDFRKVNTINKEGRGATGSQGHLKELGVAIACLFSYYLFLEVLGFLLTSFLFLFGLFWIGNPRKWLLISLSSALTVGLAYLVFSIILKTPFPSGLLR